VSRQTRQPLVLDIAVPLSRRIETRSTSAWSAIDIPTELQGVSANGDLGAAYLHPAPPSRLAFTVSRSERTRTARNPAVIDGNPAQASINGAIWLSEEKERNGATRSCRRRCPQSAPIGLPRSRRR